jgi:AcrR family transcriptional regulator
MRTGEDVDPRVARTRQLVLTAAADILAEDGFERICIDAVAERSGVARSTIYRNWPDRTSLFVEAFRNLCHGAPVAVDAGPDLRSDLEALGRHLVSQFNSAPWGNTVPSLISAAVHDEEMMRALSDFAAERRAEALAIRQRAVERGEISRPERWDAALERFVSPFFTRRLVTKLPLDDAFLASQVEATLSELGAVVAG